MAISIFARIGTIKGESSDARHKDEIDVSSWSWGLSGSGTASHAGGAGAGKATFDELRFVHAIDRASPLLMSACATGEHVKDAKITLRRAGEGQHDFLVITLNDVVVTSVSTSVSAEGDAMVESVGLSFAKVDLGYTPQKPDGTLDAGVHFIFDLQANRVG